MIFKAVTAFHRDRFILIIALFNHAVLLILADRRQFQRRNLKRLTAAGGIWSGTLPQKRQTHFIRACRLSYQLYILSNRIVKPNNRYTRQPASHDFLFYSAPDKVYVLTATNRIAMRFAVRSAPPFRYRTKRTDNSKGGIWSGTLPPAA